MAVDINRVYQKVLALANKEQRGYITPQEFNLFADQAQLDIFENYFHKTKMAEMKPKNQMDYADEVEMLEEKLHPFHVDETVNTGTSELTLPTDTHKIINVTRDGNQVTQVNKNQIAYTENNPLLKASVTRSVFVREDSGIITIYPAPSSATYDTDTTTDGLVDQESFEVSYYKRPTRPSWGYVIINDKALYNSNTSTNFELHGSEEEKIVNKILMLAGLTIKQPDVQQSAAAVLQMNNQEQNS
tara:strand:+ start:1349 stop:2080 length:732 start_codon:yes stop_codon:yes gene_type:complete